MTEPIQLAAPDPRQNQFLAALPKAEYERILPDLELVAMPLSAGL